MRKLVLLLSYYFLLNYSVGAQNKGFGSYSEEVNDSVYLLIDTMPQFPGGIVAFRSFIINSIKLPIIRCGYEGTVYVWFIIDENGKVTFPKVAKGVDPILDEEALRIVKAIPDWTPGELNGKKVKVWWLVPVDFTTRY